MGATFTRFPLQQYFESGIEKICLAPDGAKAQIKRSVKLWLVYGIQYVEIESKLI